MINTIYDIFEIDVDEIKLNKRTKKQNVADIKNLEIDIDLILLKEKIEEVDLALKSLSDFKNISSEQQMIIFKLVLKYNKLLSEYNLKLEKKAGI